MTEAWHNPAVPRWIERRGFSLRLADQTEAQSRHQVVRLSLVERRGLTGSWFNVREARAEPCMDGSARAVAGGRALSWRWLRQFEAERLLDQRLRTLQTLGYAISDAALTGRGRWDWLYELVRRGLRPPESSFAPVPRDALRNALESIGLSPDAITEGVAVVLELSPHRLREPDAPTIAAVHPEQLSVLLPFLVEHPSEEIRDIGERWLTSPGAAFQLPRPVVERWLIDAGRMGDLIAVRLRSNGLALLGPDALLRISKVSSRHSVRDDATYWLTRFA